MGGTVSYLKGAPGPSGFGSTSTAEDVTAASDLSAKTAIVTGATSGVGREAARVLAKRGARVVLAVRNAKLGEATKAQILAETPAARLEVMQLDLNSLASVRDFAANFKARNLPLHILLNNAGLILMRFELSQDGIEKLFAINHLGHFLLTNLLLDTLKSTAEATGVEGRIVNVSSVAHRFTYRCGLLLEHTNNPKRFWGLPAYGQSKLANILHAKELAHRLQEEGANVTANAVHPGTMNTQFGATEAGVLKDIFFAVCSKFTKTIPQGAATSCYVATGPALDGVSGKYFEDCNEVAKTVPAASDMRLAAALWKYSEELVAAKLGDRAP